MVRIFLITLVYCVLSLSFNNCSKGVTPVPKTETKNLKSHSANEDKDSEACNGKQEGYEFLVSTGEVKVIVVREVRVR